MYVCMHSSFYLLCPCCPPTTSFVLFLLSSSSFFLVKLLLLLLHIVLLLIGHCSSFDHVDVILVVVVGSQNLINPSHSCTVLSNMQINNISLHIHVVITKPHLLLRRT